MFLIAGINSKIKPLGVARRSVCPVCGSSAALHIINKYMTPHLFFISTFRFHNEYIATCRHCASVMILSEESGRALRRNPNTTINAKDLSVIQNNQSRP